MRRFAKAGGGTPKSTRGPNTLASLLQAFVDYPNRVVSRDQLLDLAHNMEIAPLDCSSDMRIGRLRPKIEPDPKLPNTLKTVRGAGFMFVPAIASR